VADSEVPADVRGVAVYRFDDEYLLCSAVWPEIAKDMIIVGAVAFDMVRNRSRR
jgi:hypothetical protein